MVGQAYDGCSTMAEKISGVKTRIQNDYPNANFFHCSSHKINLVINDLNDVSEVRNTVGTIKEIINFFRDSPLRRKHIPNIPLFCETRWTSKYKSLRIFSENIILIINALQDLTTTGNANTKQRAFQLYNSCINSTFLVCLFIMAEYSAILEPVTNVLQGVDQNLYSAKKQISILLQMFKNHRETAQTAFENIWEKITKCANDANIEIRAPRIVEGQKNRLNVPYTSPETFYRRSIYIPYMDSIITSLEDRFSDVNEVSYLLFEFLPENIKKYSQSEFK